MASKTQSSIKRKIITRFVPLVVVPTLILALVASIGLSRLRTTTTGALAQSETALGEDVVGFEAQERAENAADQLTVYLATHVGHIGFVGVIPLISSTVVDGDELVESRGGLANLSVDEAEAQAPAGNSLNINPEATAFLQSQVGEVYTEFVLTDSRGITLGSSSDTGQYVYREEAWWNEAWTTGTAVSPPKLDQETGGWELTVGSRIMDEGSSEARGVIGVTLSLDILDELAAAYTIGTDETLSISLGDGFLFSQATAGTVNSSDVMADSTQRLSSLIFEASRSEDPGFSINAETVSGYAKVGNPDLGRAVNDFVMDERMQAELNRLGRWTIIVERPAETAFASIDGFEAIDEAVDDSRSALSAAMAIALLLAVIAGLIGSTVVANQIVKPIRRLSAMATAASERSLPETLEAIEDMGPDEQPPTPAPIVISSGDELEHLAQSMNSLQTTATDMAVGQAIARRQRTDLFLNIGRRNQNLVSKALEQIESLERNETDSETLGGLLALDHLATRMRRNAESLVVLSGTEAKKSRGAPAPVRDIVRGAAGQIADYERVDFNKFDEAKVKGDVIGDLVHTLAELVENATNFSPPTSRVNISGQKVEDGYQIEIVDEGVGMSAERREEMNRRLADTEFAAQQSSSYLGLQVVSRLAARHDFTVSISAAKGSGSLVTVHLPTAVLYDATATKTAPKAKSGAAPAIPAPVGTTKAPEGTPKSDTTKAGPTKTDGAKTGTAKTGTTKADTAKTDATAKTGTTKTDAAKTGATKTGTAKPAPAAPAEMTSTGFRRRGTGDSDAAAPAKLDKPEAKSDKRKPATDSARTEPAKPAKAKVSPTTPGTKAPAKGETGKGDTGKAQKPEPAKPSVITTPTTTQSNTTQAKTTQSTTTDAKAQPAKTDAKSTTAKPTGAAAKAQPAKPADTAGGFTRRAKPSEKAAEAADASPSGFTRRSKAPAEASSPAKPKRQKKVTMGKPADADAEKTRSRFASLQSGQQKAAAAESPKATTPAGTKPTAKAPVEKPGQAETKASAKNTDPKNTDAKNTGAKNKNDKTSSNDDEKSPLSRMQSGLRDARDVIGDEGLTESEQK